MITIDGSQGEGGGQIIRSALALSILTQQPIRMVRIRAGRKKPGVLRQHLTALKAAARISNGYLEGAAIGASEVQFHPGAVVAGTYEFAVGTAGSTTLVLQTILLPLLMADGPSHVELRGGTHNPMAPPFPFIKDVYLPLLARMGASVEARLLRPGFYPAGGGAMQVTVHPAKALKPIALLDRGKIVSREAEALVADLDPGIGARELNVVKRALQFNDSELRLTETRKRHGPGNVLMIRFEAEHITEMFSAFGERRVSAESVARRAVGRAEQWLQADVPVGPYLADQLLLPVAVAGGGEFVTIPPLPHTTTNAAIIEKFLPVRVTFETMEENRVLVRVQPPR
ncbi:RNA 3'-terminal phosphate cyclase [bacterium]|nr:RNA 3'-terminal phosphate cyclase [bacterium]